MFSRYLFLGLSLLVTPRNIHVSACLPSCPDQPVFTPSTLVVKHGDPGSATCVICPNCTRNRMDLEVSFGFTSVNGTELTWSFDSMTEWDTLAVCFYTTDANAQCCSTLPVIVYQPPVVSIEVVNHTGPMVEHSSYTLECTVKEVAPIENLIVTFFRGQTSLGVHKPTSHPQKTPVTEVFRLSTVPTKEDDGAQYYCRADLVLGNEAPRVSRESEALNATVYYGPYLEVLANPDPITITNGDTLRLDCSAAGNPPPSYSWTLPSKSRSPYNGSVLTITTAGFEHGGHYVCSVGRQGRNVTVDFSVTVQANFIPYIIAGTIIAVGVALCGFLVVYVHHYKKTHMGKYNLRDVFRLRAHHIPLPL